MQQGDNNICGISNSDTTGMGNMQEPDNNAGTKVSTSRKPQLKGKERVSTKVFRLLLEYRDSRFFQWVHRNYVLSMALVALWGMLIIGMFLWFVIANVVRNAPVQ
jgi:hypothetical protein